MRKTFNLILQLVVMATVAAESNFMDAMYYKYPYGYDTERKAMATNMSEKTGEVTSTRKTITEKPKNVKVVKAVDPNKLTFSREADAADEAIFHAVEKVERRVEDAVRDEVDLLFCHPGSVHHGDDLRTTGDSPVVKKVKHDLNKKDEKEKAEKKVKETASKPKKKTGEVLDAAAQKKEDVHNFLEEMVRGNIDE